MFCCVFGFLGTVPSSRCHTLPESICFCFTRKRNRVMRLLFLLSLHLLGNNHSLTVPHHLILDFFHLCFRRGCNFIFLFFFYTDVASSCWSATVTIRRATSPPLQSSDIHLDTCPFVSIYVHKYALPAGGATPQAARRLLSVLCCDNSLCIID